MNKVYCCFPGGKHKALTMSYDDGRTQDRRLVPLFNQYGIKGTFHLNSGFLGDERHVRPDEVSTLYAGHEVACHTVSHPTIALSAPGGLPGGPGGSGGAGGAGRLSGARHELPQRIGER